MGDRPSATAAEAPIYHNVAAHVRHNKRGAAPQTRHDIIQERREIISKMMHGEVAEGRIGCRAFNEKGRERPRRVVLDQ